MKTTSNSLPLCMHCPTPILINRQYHGDLCLSPGLKNQSTWLKDECTAGVKEFFLSDTQSKGSGHFVVGRSPYPLQLQIWDNIQVQKCFPIRMVWFEHLCLTPRKQGSNLFSDAASAAVSEQLSLHCTGASAPTPYFSPGVNKKQKKVKAVCQDLGNSLAHGFLKYFKTLIIH